MDRLEEIEARWQAAVRGPWECTDDRGDDVMVYAERDGGGPTIFVANVGPSADGSVAAEAADQHTGKAIAAAPEDVAWLVARVRELESAGRAACAHLDALIGSIGVCQECSLGQNDPIIDTLRDAVGICRRGRPSYRCWT